MKRGIGSAKVEGGGAVVVWLGRGGVLKEKTQPVHCSQQVGSEEYLLSTGNCLQFSRTGYFHALELDPAPTLLPLHQTTVYLAVENIEWVVTVNIAVLRIPTISPYLVPNLNYVIFHIHTMDPECLKLSFDTLNST